LVFILIINKLINLFIFPGGKCNKIIDCNEPAPDGENCPYSSYCVYVSSEMLVIESEDNSIKNKYNNKENGRCVLDECVVFSLEECSRNKSCGIVERICKQIKNGSVDSSVSTPVIGGFIYLFI
jgi:hypothetical protein